MKGLNCFWQPESDCADLTLPNGEIHVWSIALDQPQKIVQQLSQNLSAGEFLRAGRFCFDHLTRRFIVGRAALRLLLAQYTGIAPSSLQFHYNAYGKPVLAEISDRASVHFNLSHSEELALFACTRGCEIGVDIDCLRPLAEAEGIAARFFSAEESRVFRALAPHQKQQAFFNCWTRKEAFLKAKGEGLSFPLVAFDVAFVPGEPAKLLHVQGNPQEAAAWSLQELHPAAGYAAACAVRGPIRNLVCRRWDRIKQRNG